MYIMNAIGSILHWLYRHTGEVANINQLNYLLKLYENNLKYGLMIHKNVHPEQKTYFFNIYLMQHSTRAGIKPVNVVKIGGL